MVRLKSVIGVCLGFRIQGNTRIMDMKVLRFLSSLLRKYWKICPTAHFSALSESLSLLCTCIPQVCKEVEGNQLVRLP